MPSGLDLLGVAGAFDDRRVLLLDDNLLGAAQIGEIHFLEGRRGLRRWLAAVRTACLPSGLAAVACPAPSRRRCSTSRQLVDDQRRECIASISSLMMSRACRLGDRSGAGQVLDGEIFFSWRRI